MTTNSTIPSWVIKVAALVLIVIGFLLLASGYRYGYSATTVGGGVLVIVGIALLLGNIVARNKKA